MPECPSPDVLSAYLHGTLADADSQTVARHVQQCIVCDALLSDLKDGQPVGQPFQADSNASQALQVARRLGQAGKPDLLEARTSQKLGPYELLEKLGQGGMGTVYMARHTKLNRIEAIKILPPHLAKDASAKNRFEREMHAV